MSEVNIFIQDSGSTCEDSSIKVGCFFFCFLWLSAPWLRVNRADPLGVTGCSGTAMTHAYTPVPARTRDPFRHIWLRAPHFRHLSVQ